MNKQIGYKNVCARLIEVIPEFTPYYEEHLKDYDEVLPHVLFGNLTRFVVDSFKKVPVDGERESIVEKSLNFVEELFHSPDPKVSELAQVSFIENLDKDDIEAMKSFFGEETKKSIKRVWGNI